MIQSLTFNFTLFILSWSLQVCLEDCDGTERRSLDLDYHLDVGGYSGFVLGYNKSIKKDKNLVATKVFNIKDSLSNKMKDDFVLNEFIEPFEEYNFQIQKIDAIGAAFEALGKLSGKDTKAGQFFTPENIVKFMVKLAELKSDDKILDPACGTARFLIHSMQDMKEKISGRNKKKQDKKKGC